jgi:hypothetical protein
MGGVKRNELALQSKVTNDHLKGAIVGSRDKCPRIKIPGRGQPG